MQYATKFENVLEILDDEFYVDCDICSTLFDMAYCNEIPYVLIDTNVNGKAHIIGVCTVKPKKMPEYLPPTKKNLDDMLEHYIQKVKKVN